MAEPNFKNRTLYHGDNLEFLRGMNSETVHLIATDPPFNKNKDFHATPDSLAAGAKFQDRWSWERDVHEEWTDQIIDDWPAVWEVITAARAAYGDDMGAFLCWLGVRLMEMHRILREDGSLYLHIDHTAHAYVKSLLDAIFGWKQFRNEIVWCYTGPSNTKRWYPKKHDTILYYSKGKNWTFNRDEIRVPYSADYVQRFKKRYNEGKDKSTIFAGGHNTERNQELARLGKLPEDWWDNFSPVGRSKVENTGYPTQKPLALYERIIKASSNKGDFVLDPFCGCATTPIAAERLDRQWVGMDIWDGARDIVLERLRDYGLIEESQLQNWQLSEAIHYATTPPLRTDHRDVAAAPLQLKAPPQVLPWQRLTRKQMVTVLIDAQGSEGGVICAGCGRVLEADFMQLDHVHPKAEGGENHIMNRILLCGPCNRRKRNYFTLTGLWRENKKKDVKWMKDESLAKMARSYAQEKAAWVRDYFHTDECSALISV
ncbi:MAG: DNA methyltransferase [Chloroflexi bacterium]|nr:DNA methyltransferase [Chloroflexota bacterium]